MKQVLFLLMLIATFSCKEKSEVETLSADEIINESIEVSGGNKFNNATIKFLFRDVFYTATRNNGKFELSRLQAKDGNSIIDFISNDGFKRIIDGLPTKIADSMALKYSASVNSVHYFSVLPYGLNDNAVNKTLIGEEQLKDKSYYKIKVTFNQEGGGEDFEDIFIYWIDKQSFKLGYLAYSYIEDHGVGIRFREAYNERFVNGLRFVDYNNYKSKEASVLLQDLGKSFEENQLKLLSKIELENVKVQLIDN